MNKLSHSVAALLAAGSLMATTPATATCSPSAFAGPPAALQGIIGIGASGIIGIGTSGIIGIGAAGIIGIGTSGIIGIGQSGIIGIGESGDCTTDPLPSE